MCYPYSVRWLFDRSEPTLKTEMPTKQGVKILISVSKRRFRRAVDRNRVKRITRECYRLRKENLIENLPDTSNHPILLSLSYIDTKMPDFQYISHRFETLMERLQKEVSYVQVGKVD